MGRLLMSAVCVYDLVKLVTVAAGHSGKGAMGESGMGDGGSWPVLKPCMAYSNSALERVFAV